MLQQILKTMWINPELLEKLDETQKQTLFCKMREEQVRRWKEWDEKESHASTIKSETKSTKQKKSVNFRTGVDGEPWVWVMGEHSQDKSIEVILAEEAREKARKLVEEELAVSQELLEMNEKNIKETGFEEKKLKIEDSFEIYCSVEELREKAKFQPLKNINNYTFNHYKNENIYNMNDYPRDVLQEITFNAPQKVAHKVALWEKKMMEERIFKKIQRKHQEVAKEAEEAEHKHQALWIEQERKAKQAEQQIREIARKAREEHRLACKIEKEVSQNDTKIAATPPNKEAVLEWYKNKEVARKAGIDETNNIEPWFHGLITRQEAETILAQKEYGSFLIRLSEKIWGYTITYRAADKCKHYLIDASNSHYQFLGNNQVNHNTLGDLIAYHFRYPLSSGECLMYPCPRKPESTAYQEILTSLSR